jgi:prevent-host-death family protein
METVGAIEAKAQFSQLLERVGRGEEFTITKDGKPIARLVPDARRVPVAEERSAEEVAKIQAAVDDMKRFREEMSRKGRTLPLMTILESIDEGRRF